MTSEPASNEGLAEHADLLDALTTAFDAVLAPEAWPEAMERLARALGADASCFNLADAGPERLNIPASSRYRDLLVEFFREGWWREDVRGQRGWGLLKAGRPVLVEDDLTTEAERRRNPLYAELFARHDLGMWATVALPVEGELWVHTVLKSERMGAFGDDDVKRLLVARPYLARLAMFAQRMAKASSLGALGALEHAARPAILLDWRNIVTDLNGPARRLLGQGLDVRKGRLTTIDPEANAHLEAITATLLRRETRNTGASDRPVLVRRPDRRPLLIEAIPARSEIAEAIGFPGAMLLITDLGAKRQGEHDVLRSAFGLTRREADVARLLADGESPERISELLTMAMSTVRHHVKSVLVKTECRRQAEVAVLLSRLPPAGSTRR